VAEDKEYPIKWILKKARLEKIWTFSDLKKTLVKEHFSWNYQKNR